VKRFFVTSVALGAFAGAAHAQSTVTLYGLIDNGLNYVSNAKGAKQFALTSTTGTPLGSRWGLLGNEDLGGGLSAIFNLENGFDTDTGKLGQNGLQFGRLAYVGLKGGFGSVTLGRQYASMVDFVGNSIVASGMWAGSFGAHAGDVDNLYDTFRVNNVLKFTSASYGGLTFGGMFSFGGQPGSFNQGSGFGAGAKYTNGALQLAVSYSDMQDPYTSAYNNGANAPAAEASPIYSGYASAGSLRILVAGGQYRFGNALVGVNYSNSRFKDLGADAGNLGAVANLSGTATFNSVELNLGYQLTPAASVYTALNRVTRGSVNGDAGAAYNQAAIGGNYRLSKRTTLYLIGAYQHASGRNSNGGPAVASLDLATPSSNDHQGAVRLGMRHTF
jgi:predicted porin